MLSGSHAVLRSPLPLVFSVNGFCCFGLLHEFNRSCSAFFFSAAFFLFLFPSDFASPAPVFFFSSTSPPCAFFSKFRSSFHVACSPVQAPPPLVGKPSVFFLFRRLSHAPFTPQFSSPFTPLPRLPLLTEFFFFCVISIGPRLILGVQPVSPVPRTTLAPVFPPTTSTGCPPANDYPRVSSLHPFLLLPLDEHNTLGQRCAFPPPLFFFPKPFGNGPGSWPNCHCYPFSRFWLPRIV